jgi:hypothetical protein
MNEHEIKNGLVEGKQVVFASTNLVGRYRLTASLFMKRIFGKEMYFISDESEVGDFVGVNDLESVEAINGKIEHVYGIVPGSPNLVKIFEQIATYYGG